MAGIECSLRAARRVNPHERRGPKDIKMKTPDPRPQDKIKQTSARPTRSGGGARLFRSQQAQIQRRSGLSWRAVSIVAAFLIVGVVGAFWLLSRPSGPGADGPPAAAPPAAVTPVAATPNPALPDMVPGGAPIATPAAPSAAPTVTPAATTPAPPLAPETPPPPATVAKKTSPSGSIIAPGKASASSAGHLAGGKIARRRAKVSAASTGAAGASHAKPVPRVKRPGVKPTRLADRPLPARAVKRAGVSTAKPLKSKVKSQTVAATGKASAAPARAVSKAAPKTPAFKPSARPKAPPTVQLNDAPPRAAPAARAPRPTRPPAPPGVELPEESPPDAEPAAESTGRTIGDGDLRDAPAATAGQAPVAADRPRRAPLE